MKKTLLVSLLLFLPIAAILLAGCEQVPEKPFRFPPGSRVRHVLTKQEGIVLSNDYNHEYTVRFAVDQPTTDAPEQPSGKLQRVTLEQVSYIKEFELEPWNR